MRWTQAAALVGLAGMAQAKTYNNIRDQEIRDCGSVGCYAKAMQARQVGHGPRKMMGRQIDNTTSSTTDEPTSTTEAATTSSPSGPAGSPTTTISVAYPTATSYAAIFALPAGSAIITTVTVNGEVVEVVLVNKGCFGAQAGVNPFTSDPEFGVAGSASECTDFCQTYPLQFSSEVVSDCYCGSAQPSLQQIDDSYCETTCPGDSTQFCGGGPGPTKRNLQNRQSSVAAQVFQTVPRSDVFVPGVDGNVTTTAPTEAPTNSVPESSVPSTEEPATTTPESSVSATTTDATTTDASASSSSTAASQPAAIPTDTNIIFGISRIGGSQPSNAVKRQTNTGSFIGGAGPVAPDNCDDATTFRISNGQLFSGDQVVSTNAGTPYIPFAVSPVVGDISTTFTSNGQNLVWANDAFPGGEAGFCQDNTGRVYATFGTEPPLCTPVNLVAYEATQCQNGQIVPPGPAPTTTPLPANQTLVLPANVFFPDNVPTGEACTWIQASWTIGEATITPFPNPAV